MGTKFKRFYKASLCVCLLFACQSEKPHQKNPVFIVPDYKIDTGTGKGSNILLRVDKDLNDSSKMDTSIIAYYLIKGDLDFDSASIKNYVLDFLDTCNLNATAKKYRGCQFFFRKTSDGDSKNWGIVGEDDHAQEDDMAELTFVDGVPGFLAIEPYRENPAYYRFNTTSNLTFRKRILKTSNN